MMQHFVQVACFCEFSEARRQLGAQSDLPAEGPEAVENVEARDRGGGKR
jgi:hypothetical protein